MPNRRVLQKAATRDRLYDVAMRLFLRHGYEAVNIDDIVRHSRVARGTFYFHFPKKDDVLLEAVRRGERRILERMRSLEPRARLPEVLTAATQGFAEVWGRRRRLLAHAGAVALRRIAEVEREREREPLRRELLQQVQRSLASGELVSVLPAQMLADLFLLDVFVALMAWAAAGSPPLSVVMPAVIDLFLRGVEGVGERGRATRK